MADLIVFFCLFLFLGLPIFVSSASGTWTQGTTGTFNWSEGTNWSGGTVPNGVDDGANFNQIFASGPAITVDLDIDVTGGGFIINGQNQNTTYTFVSSTNRTYTVDASAPNPLIWVRAGTNDVTYDSTFRFSIADSPGFATFRLVQDSSNILTIAGPIAGIGSTRKEGTGVAVFSGANNTYSGGTTVGVTGSNGGTLRAGAVNTFGTGPMTVTLGTLDLGGFSQTVGALSGANTASAIIQSTGGTPTLTTNFDESTSTFSGLIQNGTGTLALDKTGSAGTGTLVLTRANTYTGGTTISNGAISISANNNLGTSGSVTLSGGTLQTTASFSSPRAISLGAGGGTINVASSTTLTLSGAITGSTGLTKSGAGTLALASADSSYSGGTTISEGALSISSDSNLGDSSGSLTLGGGTLQTTAGFSSSRAVSLSTGGGTLDVASATTLTLSGAITGSTGLTKTSAGTLVLTSGSNAYSGGTTISVGTLALSGNGTLASAGTVTVTGTFDISGVTSQATVGDLSGAGNVLLGSKTLVAGTSGNSTYSGEMSGLGGAFTKQNAGTLTLSGTNTYSGGTTISGGVLSISSDNNLGGSSGSLTLAGGTLQTTAGFSSSRAVSLSTGGGTLDVASATTLTLSGGITGSTGLTKSSAGTLVLTSADNTYSGGTTLSAGTLSVGSGSSFGTGTVTLGSATFQTTASLTATPNLVLSGTGVVEVATGTTTWSGNLSGSGTLDKVGPGVLVLEGNNTYSGATSINAGTLRIGGASAFPSGNAIAVNATFDLDNTNVTTGALTGSGVITLGSGTLTVNSSSDCTFSGTISGSGGLTNSGSGILTLSGANTYTGALTNTGTLHSSAGGLPASIINNGTLVVNQTSNETYSGTVTGSGTFQKTGSSNLDLTGTVSQDVIVSAGLLAVNGSVSGDTTVASGATLRGIGTLGNVTLNGLVVPGNSIGTLTVGDFTFNSGSMFEVEVHPTESDLLISTGTVTINPGATLNIYLVPDVYPNFKAFRILQAANINYVAPGFEFVYQIPPTFSQTITYSDDDIFVVLQQHSIDEVVSGREAQAIAACFDQIPMSNEDHEDLYVRLAFSSLAELQHGIEQLGPQQFNALGLAQENTALAINTTLTERLADLQRNRCDQTQKQQDMVWINGFGAYADQNISHQKDFHTATGGVTAGFDRVLQDNFFVGAGLSYAYTNLRWSKQAGMGKIDSFFGELYGRFVNKDLYLEATGIGGWNQIDATRRIAFPTLLGTVSRNAHHYNHGGEAMGHIGGGYTFHPAWDLTLLAGIDGLYLGQSGFSESGADSLNLRVDGKHYTLWRGEVGFDLSKCYQKKNGIFTPDIKLSWIYERRGAGKHTTANFIKSKGCHFTVKGFNPNRNLLVPSVGFTTQLWNKNLSLNARYEAEVDIDQAKYSSHMASLRANCRF